MRAYWIALAAVGLAASFVPAAPDVAGLASGDEKVRLATAARLLEGKAESVSGFVQHAVQVSLADRRLGALGQPVLRGDPEGVVTEPRREPAEVSTDPDSGLPALTLGHPVTSDEVAVALEDE